MTNLALQEQADPQTVALLSGTAELVQNLRATLNAGTSLTTKSLLARAQHYLGSSVSEGRYDFRYLYDSIEVALHLVIEERAATLRVLEPAHIMDHLEKLISLLPTQRVRTSEQSLFQQFTTPAPLAFVAAHLALPETTTTSPLLLEPSAGTGALACIARAFGAQVCTNDLSPTRRAFLELLGFPAHSVDAENINDLLPQEIRPDLVLMNPPFSSTAGRLSRNDNQHGAQHIESALYRLNESGRLIAITGCGMGLDRPQKTEFWKRIADRYSVRMNVSLPAPTFTKFGTAWETQLIVIDKTGPTPGANWAEQVNHIRHGSATLLEILALARDNQLFIEPQLPIAAPDAEPKTEEIVLDSTSPTSAQVEPEIEPEVEPETSDGSVPYISTRLTGGIDHPAPLVESAAMAAVIPPPITYRPHLDPQLVIEGRLSTVQLERICYAGQRHSQRLPSGARAAYLLGDGTGFGKGRCLAGVIIDNANQGRTRTLWLSISNQLLESTRRDLDDLNASHIALHQLNEWDVNETINFSDGVIFCSYSTLIAKSKISQKTRLEQLVEWLGDDGVVIFDECQRAQHALATSQGAATQTGTAVLELQDHEKHPDLRFVYSSATSVVEVSHICYMTRLGLWGPETSFPGFEEFMSEIDAGGLGALEMVTRSMKAFGMSHASTLSYGRDPVSGLAVEYTEVFHELTSKQREIYNNAAEAWQIVLQNIEDALKITDAGSRKRAFALSHFWAQHQAFFRQVITAFKVPACILQIEAALERNESPVVSIIGTAEAKSKILVARAAAGGEKLEDLDFSPRATLCALVERAFPVDLYQQVEDPVNHTTITVRVTDQHGNQVQSQEALRMRAELLEKLSDLTLPENPLDQIVNYFGPDQVAEISGRRKRLIRDPRTNEVRYVSRAPKGVPMNKINSHENQQFQDGAKRIAIITAAGSTGISLHSSLNAINQQRRCHIVLELAWSAVLQMQTFGRTHRSFQKYPPRYVLLSTNLGGERRFSATIARRLASLGALCKGDRNANDGGTQLSRYTFESAIGRGTLDLLYRRIFEGAEIPNLDQPRQVLKAMGLLDRDGEVKKSDRYHIPRFLNRLLSLDCDRQNALFAYYADLFDQCVAHSKATGTFDEGVQDIKALSIKLACEPENVYVDETTKAETLHYTLTLETLSTRVTAERAEAMFESNTDSGFYRQTKGNIILATKSGNHTDQQSGNTYQTYAVTRPEEARAYYITDTELSKYKKVDPKSALAWWTLYCRTVPETTTNELHLIAGAVLPLWQRLKTTKDAQLKVVRVVTADNQRIVGIKIPSNRVQQVLRALGIATAISDPADIIHAILKNDDQITLVEGLSLCRAKIYSTAYVEVRGATHHKFPEFRKMGLLNMAIEYKQRFFLPTNPNEAVRLLESLLQRYPTVEPVNEPQEVPLPTREFSAIAQTETVNIFDLLQAPRPITPPALPIPANELATAPIPPTTYNAAFQPAQLDLWQLLNQAAA
jgi:predicted RNA methylase